MLNLKEKHVVSLSLQRAGVGTAVIPVPRLAADTSPCLGRCLPPLPTAELRRWLKTAVAINSPFPEPALRPQPVLVSAGCQPADSAQTQQRGGGFATSPGLQGGDSTL